LRNNISVGVQYLGAWLAGNGCVSVFNLMEDAATAEIARSQIWQWIRSPKGVLDDGRKITVALFRQLLGGELPRIRKLLGEEGCKAGRYEEAVRLFDEITSRDEYAEFLTLPAYDLLTAKSARMPAGTLVATLLQRRAMKSKERQPRPAKKAWGTRAQTTR